MKVSLLALTAAACTLAAPADAQKDNKGTLLQPDRAKGSQAATSPGSAGVAAATPTQPGVAFVGPNDACASATAITGGGPFAFDTVGATTDGPAACGNFTNDVWFDWTAPATANYGVSLCSGAAFDTEIAVYATSACVGTLLRCNDDCCALLSYATFAATSGSVYKIRIGGYNGQSGTGTFTVTALPAVAASPDSCAAAAVVVGAGPHSFNNFAATTGAEGQANANCNYFGEIGIANDVWFRWTAGASGSATLSLCSGTICSDTKVAVYAGAGCPVAQAIACNDDSCDLLSEVHFCVTSGQQYTFQVGNYPSVLGGIGSFTISIGGGGAGNDECTGATVLPPTGPYAFDNSSATTSCVGQSNALCNFFGTPGIEHDRWYRWTAGSSGIATVSTCGTTSIDSKMAVYAGAGCPTGQAIACSDDDCASLQTSVCFTATSGQSYMIQLGTYPGTPGGAGTFNVTVAPPPAACQHDDGTSEDALGFGAGGELVWIQRFGSAPGSTTVSSIQVTWGTPAFPGGAPGNGLPAKVVLYDDPNDDGNPSDAVLVQLVNTTVMNVDTDIFNNVPVPPSIVNGVFFAGASIVHASGQFVAPMDETCVASDHAWFFGDNTGGAVDYTTPSANPVPPQSFESVPAPANLMVRVGCNASPMVQVCLPGQGGIIACPCSNPPAGTGLGCNNFGAGPVDSGELDAIGTASLSSDTVVLQATGENNTALTVFWQGRDPVHATGLVHGAGVRCVTNTLKRLYTGNASGGAISRPLGADPSVHARSAAVGDTILAGQNRHYFTIYRDPAAAGPCGNPSSTINLTNAGTINWGP